MNELLKLECVSKRYPEFTLDNVSLTVEAGNVVGFVGSNGAGKTTVIKSILGLISIDEGSVSLFGERIDPRSSRAAQLRESIGVVLDTCAFPGECHISEVGFIGRNTFANWQQSIFDELIASFGLSPRKRVKELSRGMGMKLTLSFALAHQPRLLVLDEPTAGLDPLAREDALNLLRTFMEDERNGILISSHITSDLERIADRLVCIENGRIAFDVPKDDICDMAGIVRCRADELERILASGFLKPYADSVRLRRSTYETDLLVPDRFAFQQAFPHVLCEHATIDDYLSLTLKGEAL